LILHAKVDDGFDAELFQIFKTLPTGLPATVKALRDLTEPRNRS
jgi:hypothetical protein